MTEVTKKSRKTRVGVVTSNKMDKSIVLKVERRLRHPIYGKFVKKSKKFMAHDEKNECNIGDTCLLYTSPSPRDATLSRMPSSA